MLQRWGSLVRRLVGYPAGLGGAETQITSKTTTVTLNALTGQITTTAGLLSAGTSLSFLVNNSFVESTDIPVLALSSGCATNTYQLGVESVGSGTFRIIMSNVSGVNQSQALVINFAIIKGAAS